MARRWVIPAPDGPRRWREVRGRGYFSDRLATFTGRGKALGCPRSCSKRDGRDDRARTEVGAGGAHDVTLKRRL
ncbi:unnamed protein product [Lampetra planeri]